MPKQEDDSKNTEFTSKTCGIRPPQPLELEAPPKPPPSTTKEEEKNQDEK
jgi:hypothetical protein